MNQLEDDQKRELKGQRFLLLRNIEDLSAEAREELSDLRKRFCDLGTASAMKEYLRNIYRMAPRASTAKLAFEKWCAMADESGIVRKSLSLLVASPGARDYPHVGILYYR